MRNALISLYFCYNMYISLFSLSYYSHFIHSFHSSVGKDSFSTNFHLGLFHLIQLSLLTCYCCCCWVIFVVSSWRRLVCSIINYVSQHEMKWKIETSWSNGLCHVHAHRKTNQFLSQNESLYPKNDPFTVKVPQDKKWYSVSASLISFLLLFSLQLSSFVKSVSLNLEIAHVCLRWWSKLREQKGNWRKRWRWRGERKERDDGMRWDGVGIFMSAIFIARLERFSDCNREEFRGGHNFK